MDPLARAARNASYFGRRCRYWLQRGQLDLAIELAKAAYRWALIAKPTL